MPLKPKKKKATVKKVVKAKKNQLAGIMSSIRGSRTKKKSKKK